VLSYDSFRHSRFWKLMVLMIILSLSVLGKRQAFGSTHITSSFAKTKPTSILNVQHFNEGIDGPF
jgi:hypothetical protein